LAGLGSYCHTNNNGYHAWFRCLHLVDTWPLGLPAWVAQSATALPGPHWVRWFHLVLAGATWAGTQAGLFGSGPQCHGIGSIMGPHWAHINGFRNGVGMGAMGTTIPWFLGVCLARPVSASPTGIIMCQCGGRQTVTPVWGWGPWGRRILVLPVCSGLLWARWVPGPAPFASFGQ